MDGIAISPQNLLLLASGLLFLVGLIFLIVNIRLMLAGRYYKRLMQGVQGANLEDLLKETLRSYQGMRGRLEELESSARRLVMAQDATIQGVGFVRFDAFSERGEMSFALALLNRKADGVVFCCITSLDDCRLYARQLVGGVSTQPMSVEEKEAVRKALASLQQYV
jgi:hypothetical protein